MSAILLRDALADELGKLMTMCQQKVMLGKCASFEDYKAEVARYQAYEKALTIAEKEQRRLNGGGVRADSLPAQQRANGR